MGIVISLLNHKGGVGKTTSAVNIGAAMVELGKRVLLIDLDPRRTLLFLSAFHARRLLYTRLCGERAR